MKLKIFMFICCLGTIQANTLSQVNQFSLKKNGVEITKILEELQSNSEYQFFYQKGIFSDSKNVDINLTNASLKEVLDELLTLNGYGYEVIGNVVTVRRMPVQPDKKQAVRITGKITDKDGSPIPGVNIRVKNGVLGTVTDLDGNYSIVLPAYYSDGFTLVYTFIGMETQEVEYQGENVMDVIMVSDEEELGEVVVTGYQVIDKRELTSSIETIKSEDLDKISSLTIDQMIEGKVPGLMVTNLSSTPGAAAKIRVRSGGTFTGSRAPLWVVDGIIYEDPVPLSAEEINSFDQVNIIGNALTGINPQDIESINILKDASATAIYGTRAANGVIVVMTKRGKKGKPSFTYSGSMSVVNRPYYSDFNLMNSLERVDVSREIAQKNLGYPNDIFTWLGYEKVMRDYRLGNIDYSEFQYQVGKVETMNADWFGELYRPAINTNHSISLSGGTDNVRYYHSIGYNDNEGAERGVNLNRITARSNLDITVNEKLKVSLGMSGSVQEANYNHSSINLFDQAYYSSRTTPIKNEDGSLFYVENKLRETSFGAQTYRYNVLNEMDNAERAVNNKDFNLNAQLQWNIAKGVRLSASGSYRTTSNSQEEWIKANTAFVAKLRSYDAFEQMIKENVKQYGEVPFGGLYSGGMTSQRSLRGQVQMNLSKVIAKHVFNLNLGYEANSTAYDGSNGWTAPGYNHDQGRSFITLPYFTLDKETSDLVNYDYINMLNWLTEDGGSYSIYPSITDRLSNQLSAFGIFNYAYDNRYIVNFNMRSDGSNRFGQYERYKFKPTWSASGRWNIHNEHFWNNNGNIEELSLRLSYGFRGTSPQGTPYMVINRYIYNSKYNEDKANMASFPNANLTWEKTSTLNAGLNYSLFSGRVNGAFDFAYSHGKDLLLSRPVSLVNGMATQLYNGGEKEDYSYEFSLSGTIIRNETWGWRLSANTTLNDENILAGYEAESVALDVSDYLNGSIYLTGFPLDGFYSYQFDGLNEEGLPSYKNLENKSETLFDLLKDVLVYSGRRSPKVYGGFSTEVRFKQFTMRAGFSYKLGHHTRLLKLYQGEQSMPMPHENLSSEFSNRWRQPGDEAWAPIPGLSNNSLNIGTAAGHSNNYYVVQDESVVPGNATGWTLYDLSDARVVDASHIRWQSLRLSYNLPKLYLEKFGFKSMVVSGSIDNIAVWTFDKKMKGQDPEQVRSIGMPLLPTYSVSLNFGF